MTSSDRGGAQSKVSPGLASHLSHLEPGEKVRVIVMLRTQGAAKGGQRRSGSAEREAAVKAMKESARNALSEVDRILERFHGRRLADGPDALGAVPVEATAAGVRALARSRSVKAIMEDQSFHLAF
jgi:hypothetical protein